MSDKIVKYTVEDYIDRYEAPVKALMYYLPWLEKNMETGGAQDYKDSETTMAFPVYDSNLLAFVKQAQNTKMLDRNYHYVYSRHSLRNAEDELRFIERARLQDMDDLWGILSRYVQEGMTQGAVWSEGVKNGVMGGVIGLVSQYFAIQPQLENLRPILEAVPETTEDKQEAGQLSGAIEVNHLSFAYTRVLPDKNGSVTEVEGEEVLKAARVRWCVCCWALRCPSGAVFPLMGRIWLNLPCRRYAPKWA